ncbi:helix-turn-helix domain-containing protein [Corynebacterium coyleae]|uniref:helix-turn-helix domain-containing protein n=1 Tax=Corynebacterium coyleae TaxID=53374 RepID=UPI0011AE5D17|nr:helix-turn-helix domain-containing protein [Corynebacterium coyleae]
MAELPALGELIPVKEFAAATDSHPRTIQRLCREAELPAIQVGAKWFILGNELLSDARARVLGTDGDLDGLAPLTVANDELYEEIL